MNNDYIMVGIDIDTAENITSKVLEEQFWDIEPLIGGCPLFSEDHEENIRLCDELIDAYVKVLDYNGVYIVKKRGKYVRQSKL